MAFLNIYTQSKFIGLLLGPLGFYLILMLMDGLEKEPRAVLATTVWVSVWWISEALPIPATSLLPLILLPVSGGLDSDSTASAYANPVVFMYMGGFIIAIAIEKWKFHKRIALSILCVIGTRSNRIILGVLLATSFMSMWINNTATTLMMLPIALALIKQIDEEELMDAENLDSFRKGLLLTIAYSATIGGLATLIGSIPNAVFAAIASKLLNRTITFTDWLMFGLPLSLLLLVVLYFYMTRALFPVKINTPLESDFIRQELRELGPLSLEEKLVALVFLITASLWVFGGFLPESINDSMIAIFGSLLLFFLPSGKASGERLLEWEDTAQLPWGLLLLFGGGLALASAFKESRLTEWIGEQLSLLNNFPYFILIVLLGAIILFLTEIMSNTAVSNMVIPITVGLSAALGIEPYGLMATAALASSCAFMLPISTAPNAIIFSSDYINMSDMIKAGFWLNIISLIVITLLIYYWLPIIF